MTLIAADISLAGMCTQRRLCRSGNGRVAMSDHRGHPGRYRFSGCSAANVPKITLQTEPRRGVRVWAVEVLVFIGVLGPSYLVARRPRAGSGSRLGAMVAC